MKIKNLVLVVLMVILVVGVSFCQEKEDSTTVFFDTGFNSRYVLYGFDFLPNNYSFTSIGGGMTFKLPKGDLLIYEYVGIGKNYVEGGLLAEYTLPVGNLLFKSSIFPFVWAFSEEKSDWGAIVGQEISVQTFLNPGVGYCYLWAELTDELKGHYFFVELSETLLTIDWEARLGYAKDFVVEKGQGFNAMIGASKTISLTKNLSTTLFLKFFWNDPELNENEIPVFGIITTFTL